MLNRVRAWVRITFGFSRSEVNGFLILLPLLVLILLSGPVTKRWMGHNTAPDTTYSHLLDSIVATWEWPAVDSTAPEPTRFRFDPNKATEQELILLGVPKYVAARIVNYRNKGGKFRVKGDFKKMYGLDSSIYAQLSPYLLLPEKQPSLTSTPFPKPSMPYLSASKNLT